ncbi:MAG: rod-binding protein [Treponema sp.]|nr:rod-binding protein [Treponema sp.]MCL2181383.1 rod-binding protein [Treponema sp.]
MEISGFGLMNLEDYRLSSSPDLRAPMSFSQLLDRARSVDDKGSRPAAPKTPGLEPTIDKSEKLYQLCLELETFLVKNLLTSMRGTVQKSGLVDDSFAGKMYEDMLYDEYAKDFTKNADFGLAEQAYRQLLRYS